MRYPTFSKTLPEKAWHPGSKTLAALDIEVFEGSDQYPLVFRGATVTVGKGGIGYSVWEKDEMDPSGRKDERGYTIKTKVYDWNPRIRSAILSSINDPMSDANYDNSDTAYLDDAAFGQLHDAWLAETTAAWPEVATLYAQLDYPGWMGGGGTSDASAGNGDEGTGSELDDPFAEG